MPPKKHALIVDIGSGNSSLAKAISEFGRGKCQIFRINVAESDFELRKDTG